MTKGQLQIKIEAYTEIRSKIRGVTSDDPHSGLNRQDIIRKYVRPGMELIPTLEPKNPYHANAIGLWLIRKTFLTRQKFYLGHLKRSLADDLAPILREGQKINITVTEVTGGTKGKKTRGVNLLIRY